MLERLLWLKFFWKVLSWFYFYMLIIIRWYLVVKLWFGWRLFVLLWLFVCVVYICSCKLLMRLSFVDLLRWGIGWLLRLEWIICMMYIWRLDVVWRCILLVVKCDMLIVFFWFLWFWGVMMEEEVWRCCFSYGWRLLKKNGVLWRLW